MNIPAGADKAFATAALPRPGGNHILVVFDTLVFGSASSTTLWGRFAAWMDPDVPASKRVRAHLSPAMTSTAFASAARLAFPTRCLLPTGAPFHAPPSRPSLFQRKMAFYFSHEKMFCFLLQNKTRVQKFALCFPCEFFLGTLHVHSCFSLCMRHSGMAVSQVNPLCSVCKVGPSGANLFVKH